MALNKGIAALVFLSVLMWAESSRAESLPSFIDKNLEVSLHVMRSVANKPALSNKTILGESLRSASLVSEFYSRRAYLPVWSQFGRLVQVEDMIKAIREAREDGLAPEYYHLEMITSIKDKTTEELLSDPKLLADLDILLTDAFITLSCHLSGGCQNPTVAASEWFASRSKIDPLRLLEKAASDNKAREYLLELRPKKDIYTRLKEALRVYRELAAKGGWTIVSAGPVLKKGDRSLRVKELRRRLNASGDLPADASLESDLFDEGLERAVVHFQERHGFRGDGTVGRETLNALNAPIKQRIRQIQINLERLRWLLGGLGERFILVNIPNFRLDIIENGQSVLSMKVVVGKPDQSTPVFSSAMTYLVINPSWYIPKNIVRKEILAKMAKNPNYLTEQEIEVTERDGAKGWKLRERIDQTFDSGGSSAYRFRQRPGARNPLGVLKFMLPNRYDVYLHDTPSKKLFLRDIRAFSHGCIRLENPLGLAEYLLKDEPHWTPARLKVEIAKGKERSINLPKPIDTHLIYITAWVDEKGVLQFRNDIYGLDKKFNMALVKTPYIQ